MTEFDLPKVKSTADAVPVLAEHTFDVKPLEGLLAARLDDLTPPITLGQVEGGMSNPTLILTDDAGKRFVLRKKPPGTLLPSAHAVDREFRVMTALGNSGVPVPAMRLYCDDPGVIGTEFYVMDFLDGRIFRDPGLPDLAPDQRGAIHTALIETLAKLHGLDYAALGLGDYGRVGGYVERQTRRWADQYEKSRTEEIPAMERLGQWLADNMPAEDETSLVHGDYRLDNLIFHPTEPKVLAVIDWELSTLGAPLAELAYYCLPYHLEEPAGRLTPEALADGIIPSEDQVVETYRALTGRSEIPHWNFYLAFSMFRLAAILQGVYKRALDGNASSRAALRYKDSCRQMAETAMGLI